MFAEFPVLAQFVQPLLVLAVPNVLDVFQEKGDEDGDKSGYRDRKDADEAPLGLDLLIQVRNDGRI